VKPKPVVEKASAKPKVKFTSSRVLKVGDRGTDVRSLQRTLNSLGYKLTADSIFGKATDNALKNFQRKNGLIADGRPGTLTKKMLNR